MAEKIFLMQILVMITGLVFDIAIFLKITEIKPNLVGYVFLIFWEIFLTFIQGFHAEYSYQIYLGIVEAVGLTIYFLLFKKAKNAKLIVGALTIMELGSIICGILLKVLTVFFPPYGHNGINYNNFWIIAWPNLFASPLEYVVICLLKEKITKLLQDENSNSFLGLLVYLYIVCSAISVYIMDGQKPSEVILMSFGILIFQSVFSIAIYTEITHVQKQLLSKQRQEALVRDHEHLVKEHRQLKEYADYLDQNEDELRRFKHDYQNILTSLKISAEKGHAQDLVEQLDKYTDSQFNQKALRKYPDVNHIHVSELKSIVIAKLAKLYSAKIDYSFGCEQDIDKIPQSVDLFDLVRIIGIAFDNAIEASKQLVEQNGKADFARVEAMYYQEDGDFEFMIRNRVASSKINSDRLSEEGYTTKKNHTGIGLANVKQITSKYEQTMMTDYGVSDGWFSFNLTILPDNVEEF